MIAGDTVDAWGPARFERAFSSLQGWRDDLCATVPELVCPDQRQDLAGARADPLDQLAERGRSRWQRDRARAPGDQLGARTCACAIDPREIDRVPDVGAQQRGELVDRCVARSPL